jgi:hypothetical protein
VTAALNTWAAFPVPAATAQYRMGPLFTPSASDFVFNTRHADGTYTICKDPEGWHGLDFITPIDQAGGRDGGLIGPQSIGPRTIDVAAMIVAPNPQLLWQKVAAVRSILAAKQPVIWEQFDFGAGFTLAMVTRPTGKFQTTSVFSHQPGGLAISLAYSLIVATPWKYLSGTGESANVGLVNPALITGRTYDKTYSYTYGSATNPGGVMQVVNQGDSAAYPVFTITGPVNFPTVTNVTTGQSFQVNAAIGAGTTVVIDSNTGSVSPGNIRLIGRPFVLAPGVNTIRWTDSLAAYDPAANLLLNWRSTFK